MLFNFLIKIIEFFFRARIKIFNERLLNEVLRAPRKTFFFLNQTKNESRKKSCEF